MLTAETTEAIRIPYDLTAERAVLGSILLEREAIIALQPLLQPADFYLEKHAHVYEAALECLARPVPPDLATLADVLRRRGRLEPIGGVSFLSELAGEVPTAVHAEYYAAIVARAARRRRLIEAAGTVHALACDERIDDEAAMDMAEAAVFRVTQDRRAPTTVGLDGVMDALYQLLRGGQGRAGVATGYADLDVLLGGLHPGDLALLAARPGTGKTALALNLAEQVAEQGLRVAIFSLEMSREQLGQRMVAMRTGIDLQRLRVAPLHEFEVSRVIAAMGALSDLPIVIDDGAAPSVLGLRAQARRLHAEGELGLIIIDYLQLLSSGRRSENRVQEVSEVSRSLKQLARELRVPILALSQLSRAVESRAGRLPQLSDLRDSGALEQDADVVMFLHREELSDPASDRRGIAEIHVAKHRNGPTGSVALHFAAATNRFRSLARQES